MNNDIQVCEGSEHVVWSMVKKLTSQQTSWLMVRAPNLSLVIHVGNTVYGIITEHFKYIPHHMNLIRGDQTHLGWFENILCLLSITTERVLLAPGNQAERLSMLLVDERLLFLTTLNK